jgi:hypothetical protein
MHLFLAGGEMAAGELNKPKAAELKAELKKRGVLVESKKADLVERLEKEKALAEDDEEAEAGGEVEVEEEEAGRVMAVQRPYR